MSARVHELPSRHRPLEVGFAVDSCLDADVAGTAAYDPKRKFDLLDSPAGHQYNLGS
jgi:hypothetical protein